MRVEINWRRAMALLESGQIGNVNERRNSMTMLHWAVEDREVAAIKALLRHGADATLGRNGGIPYTPLMRAASYGYNECVAALVSGGADVNYCTPAGEFVSSNALHQAVSKITMMPPCALLTPGRSLCISGPSSPREASRDTI